jgi:hypothetical protein
MVLTALQPAPPTPTTLIRISEGSSSGNENILALLSPGAVHDNKQVVPHLKFLEFFTILEQDHFREGHINTR